MNSFKPTDIFKVKLSEREVFEYHEKYNYSGWGKKDKRLNISSQSPLNEMFSIKLAYTLGNISISVTAKTQGSILDRVLHLEYSFSLEGATEGVANKTQHTPEVPIDIIVGLLLSIGGPGYIFRQPFRQDHLKPMESQHKLFRLYGHRTTSPKRRYYLYNYRLQSIQDFYYIETVTITDINQSIFEQQNRWRGLAYGVDFCLFEEKSSGLLRLGAYKRDYPFYYEKDLTPDSYFLESCEINMRVLIDDIYSTKDHLMLYYTLVRLLLISTRHQMIDVKLQNRHWNSYRLHLTGYYQITCVDIDENRVTLYRVGTAVVPEDKPVFDVYFPYAYSFNEWSLYFYAPGFIVNDIEMDFVDKVYSLSVFKKHVNNLFKDVPEGTIWVDPNSGFRLQYIPAKPRVTISFHRELLGDEEPVATSYRFAFELLSNGTPVTPEAVNNSTNYWFEGNTLFCRVNEAIFYNKLKAWVIGLRLENKTIKSVTRQVSRKPLQAELRSVGGKGTKKLHQQAIFIYNTIKESDLEFEIVNHTSLPNPVREDPHYHFDVQSGEDWFEIDVKVSFDGIGIPPAVILDAVRNGEREVTLKDGSTGLIPEDLYSQIQDLLTFNIADGRSSKIHLSKFNLLLTDKVFRSISIPPTILDHFNKLEQITKQAHNPRQEPIQPPALFEGKLFRYQEKGLHFLRTLSKHQFGAALCDDAGLGKTIQSIALIADLKEEHQDKYRGALVVVPLSVLEQWRFEFKHFAPRLSVLVHHGQRRVKDSSRTPFESFDVVLTSYGTLTNDQKLFETRTWQVLIADEATAFKNHQTETFKIIRSIPTRLRVALTGTPIENSIMEFHAVLDFCNPGLLGNRTYFAKRFKSAIEKDRNQELLTKIARLVKPYFLRRTKQEVDQQLPTLNTNTALVTLLPKQRAFYETTRIAIQQEIRQAKLNGANYGYMVMTGLTRLRQICLHPSLISSKGVTDSIKLHYLTEKLLEITTDHKVLVFSIFKEMIDLCSNQLENNEIDHVVLTGSTSKSDRVGAVKRFQEDPTCRVFLSTTKAGGYGLNLMAADYIFILDPWWNPQVEHQAISRAHRTGQKNKVFATKIIAVNTIEEKIVALQEKKSRIAKDILDPNTGNLTNLTLSEMEDLLMSDF